MLKPLSDRLLVKSIVEEKSKGGIILPDAARDVPQSGIVMAVGAGKVLESGERQPLEVKEGETVIFSRYSGVEIKLPEAGKGEIYYILREKEILARKGE